MPKPREFLRGFNIKKGMILANNFELINIRVEHITIKRYREYGYHLIMIWQQIGEGTSVESLIKALKRYTNKQETIYTSYGNPYLCTFSPKGSLKYSQDGDIITIDTVGHCTRI